ncbi:tyrosine-type recombinase/integrase [Pseudonocardia sp. T1-2H]|uniref:tyrosine-type recombinase/integrase n=1 Tax=Pseudonocardia sp. T1-2H TaxID=3128899 RepID=UPI0040545872
MGEGHQHSPAPQDRARPGNDHAADRSQGAEYGARREPGVRASCGRLPVLAFRRRRKQPQAEAVTRRYSRLVQRLGIRTTCHKLRHYSATELIAGGVDVRTVAGRLGHGGGGATTLRVYTPWVSEADQRASSGLLDRLPCRPAGDPGVVGPEELFAQNPFELTAMDLRSQILDGTLGVGAAISSCCSGLVPAPTTQRRGAPTAMRRPSIAPPTQPREPTHELHDECERLGLGAAGELPGVCDTARQVPPINWITPR